VRKTPLIVMSIVIPLLTAVPVLTVPGPTAHPVTPKVTVTPLSGVDAGALRDLLATHPRANVLSVTPASFTAGPPQSVPSSALISDPAVPDPAVPDPAVPDPVVLTGKRDSAPFDLVGVTWAATDPALDSAVSIRVREAGTWTAWEPLGLEDAGPDATSAEARAVRRVGTAPLLVDHADGIQVRVDRPGGRVPTDLRVNLIDAGQVAFDGQLAPSAPARTASAGSPYPNIILRSQWGADETLRSAPAEYNATVKVGVVHHTAGTNAYSAAEAAAQVRAVYAYHTLGHGWSDIGYNFLVDRFGRIYEGRAGGMDMPVRGAHAGGYNVDTVGVAALGNFEAVRAPTVMIDAIARVLAWKLSLYNRDAYGTTALMSQGGGTARLPMGETRDFPTIMGHRDVGATTCPGRYLFAKLPALRAKVKGRINAAPWTNDPPVPPATVDPTYFGPAADPALDAVGPLPPSVAPLVASFALTSTTSGILRSWFGRGGPASALGQVVSEEFAVPGGAAQDFTGGRIYWSQQTGARSMTGDILRRYAEMAGPASILGFATADEMATINNGTYVLMTGGKILFHPSTGAQPLWGDIQGLYDKMGAELGVLAFPRDVETVMSTPTVVRQRFDGGNIYWSPDRGARAVVGAIFNRYVAEGAEDGPLGVPLTGEYFVPEGTRSDFAGGSLTWSPATGEVIVTR